MSKITPADHLASFTLQIDGVSSWLANCLATAGITGATAQRAMTRLAELKVEVEEVFQLILSAPCDRMKCPKVITYFGVREAFPLELTERANTGIEEMGRRIGKELSEIASTRSTLLYDTQKIRSNLENASSDLWIACCACDNIVRVGETVAILAAQAGSVYQFAFLHKALVKQG